MKIPAITFVLSCTLLIQGSDAYSVFKNNAPSPKAPVIEDIDTQTMSRRNLLRSAATLTAGALLAESVNPGIANASEDVATPVYFGVGVSTTKEPV